jgi:hypothetical protein
VPARQRLLVFPFSDGIGNPRSWSLQTESKVARSAERCTEVRDEDTTVKWHNANIKTVIVSYFHTSFYLLVECISHFVKLQIEIQNG